MSYEKTGKTFLNTVPKIILAEKESEISFNNAEQKIILCKMLELVYVENSKQFL